MRLAIVALTALALVGARTSFAQTPDPTTPAAAPAAAPSPVPNATAEPIAFVPLDNNPDSAAKVSGAIEVSSGKAVIAKSGTVTSGNKTTEVVLPRRGVLRVCASTSVHLSSDASVPAGETPGLMMALDHGAVEASFATGQNSDILLTPDFRILIGGPGSADVKVRLGQHGDTCVDNPGANAPYVVVSSVFEGGAYRVQPGQRVMFQHGSLKEVVDQEKEPCGCPPEARPGSNDFPLAQSAGLAPLEKPVPAAPPPAPPANPPQKPQLNEPLVYTAPRAAQDQAPQQPAPTATPAAPAQTVQPSAPAPTKKKAGFFRSIGRFFKKVFGAD
jgi:hypothetical protein